MHGDLNPDAAMNCIESEHVLPMMLHLHHFKRQPVIPRYENLFPGIGIYPHI